MSARVPPATREVADFEAAVPAVATPAVAAPAAADAHGPSTADAPSAWTAEHAGGAPVERGDVLQHIAADGTFAFHRVLALGPAREYVVWIDVEAPDALPEVVPREDVDAGFAAGMLRPQPRDPWAAPALADEYLTPNARKHRDRRWAAIRTLAERADHALFDPDLRGRLVASAAAEARTSREEVYRWLRLYWQRGLHVGALVPHYDRCGAPGRTRAAGEAKRGARSDLARQDPEQAGVNVTPEWARDLVTGAQLFLETEGLSLPAAYQRTLELFFNDGYTHDGPKRVPVMRPAHLVPTVDQFRYWYHKQRDAEDSLKRKEGARRFPLRRRPVLDLATDLASGPGSLYQIDATGADLHLLSRWAPLALIGRPVLYLVRDSFPGAVVTGVHLALDGPNWMGASMALQHSVTDKVAFCAKFGITITEDDWPCRHIPAAVLGDRGEMLAGHADHVANVFKTRVSNAPPHRPDWKPIVERFFKTLNDEVIHWQPGAVHHARERGDPDYRLEAKLTLYDFWRVIIFAILHYNRHHRWHGALPSGFATPDGASPTPLELWRWGVRHRSGHLRVADPEWARVQLLPGAQARVTRRGLLLHGLYYDCPTARAEGWFVDDPSKRGSAYVHVAYDPRDVAAVFLRGPKGDGTEPCTLLREGRRFAGLTLQEVQDWRKRTNAADLRKRTEDRQALAERNADIDAVEAEADARIEALTTAGQRLTVKHVRERRAEELRDLRREEVGAGGTPVALPPGTAAADEPGASGPRDAQPRPPQQPPQRPLQLLPAPAPAHDAGYVPAPRSTDLLRAARARRASG